MKVLRLRAHYGIPGLKGEDAWTATDKDTALRMLPSGHFIVSKYGKHELVPSNAVRGASVEPDPQPMELVSSTVETVASIPIEGMTMTLKKGPTKPKKPAPAEQPT